jgi:hypothetical protein
MGTNLIGPSELQAAIPQASDDPGVPLKVGHGITKWFLVAAQVLTLMAYAMGMAFLVKTTAGTLVLFSLVAPALVGIAVVTLIGVAVREFRNRQGVSVFEIYDTGQIIFRQGESGDCAYFIQSGEVEVIRQENGSENIVAKLSEGEYFGEKALISSAPRTATIRAATTTRVGVIRKKSFLTMILVMPARQQDVIHHQRMGKRARKYAV